MRCPRCYGIFDLYDAILDEDNTGEWLCPTCGVTLDDSDAKEVK